MINPLQSINLPGSCMYTESKSFFIITPMGYLVV